MQALGSLGGHGGQACLLDAFPVFKLCSNIRSITVLLTVSCGVEAGRGKRGWGEKVRHEARGCATSYGDRRVLWPLSVPNSVHTWKVSCSAWRPVLVGSWAVCGTFVKVRETDYGVGHGISILTPLPSKLRGAQWGCKYMSLSASC